MATKQTKVKRKQIHLTLPHQIVPSLNKLYAANRHTRARLARDAHEAICWAIYERLGRDIVPLPAPVMVSVSVFAARPYDIDNYFKLLLDSMVEAGVLVDDGYKYIVELRGRVHKVGKADERIEVHIQAA